MRGRENNRTSQYVTVYGTSKEQRKFTTKQPTPKENFWLPRFGRRGGFLRPAATADRVRKEQRRTGRKEGRITDEKNKGRNGRKNKQGKEGRQKEKRKRERKEGRKEGTRKEGRKDGRKEGGKEEVDSAGYPPAAPSAVTRLVVFLHSFAFCDGITPLSPGGN